MSDVLGVDGGLRCPSTRVAVARGSSVAVSSAGAGFARARERPVRNMATTNISAGEKRILRDS